MDDVPVFAQVRTWIIVGVCVLVAAWLAVTAVGGVARFSSPDLVLAMPVKNGFAYEQRVVRGAMVGNAGVQDIKVDAQGRADALAALRFEPLASSALTLLGLDRARTGDQAGAAALIQRAHAIDKRQLIANAWLINYHGTAGHARIVLGLLDEALKVQPDLQGRYMPAFAQALEDRDTIPVFETLLRRQPTWQDSFWQAVASRPASLPNAETLRSRLVAGPLNLNKTDALLMDAFIRNGRLDLALSFARKLPHFPEDAGNLIRNSSFSQLSLLPPLDWQLISDGRVGSAIDEAQGTLDMNAVPGASAVTARQLIAIPPGAYMLTAKLGQSSLTAGSALDIHLFCAEANDAGAPKVDAEVVDDAERAFVIPQATNCRFYWVTVEFSTINAGTPALAALAELRITRNNTPRAETAVPPQ